MSKEVAVSTPASTAQVLSLIHICPYVDGDTDYEDRDDGDDRDDDDDDWDGDDDDDGDDDGERDDDD